MSPDALAPIPWSLPCWEVYERQSQSSIHFRTRRAAEAFIELQFTPEQRRHLLLCRNGVDEDWIVRDYAYPSHRRADAISGAIQTDAPRTT
jgi:hypothetical protein